MKKEERKDYFAPKVKEVRLRLEQAILGVSKEVIGNGPGDVESEDDI